MLKVAVYDYPSFADALAVLRQLNPKTHGDTLKLFLAFKFYQREFPAVTSSDAGLSSGDLEKMLDSFYTKESPSLGNNNGKVCQIFTESFTPTSSYDQNNWRDFFRYALGISCLASAEELSSEFLEEPRSACPHMLHDAVGDYRCSLHPSFTKYIRGINKPKLLQWITPGKHGTYKLVDLSGRQFMDVIRPITMHMPLEQLIVALYFGAPWTNRKHVTTAQFAEDFHFEDAAEVDYLFGTKPSDPITAKLVVQRSRDITAKLMQPFNMAEAQMPGQTTEARVRDAAFADLVCEAYDNTCAVCGLRIETPEGRRGVQAAHIFPKRFGGADDIRNGIALCHTHHWAFDEFLFTIGGDFSLVWKTGVAGLSRSAKSTLQIPKDQQRFPDQDQALAWHRGRFYTGTSALRTRDA